MSHTQTKVAQFEGRNGTVKNQFIITSAEGRYFQSYNSIIAFIGNDGRVKIDKTYWDYSRTTGKYRNQFLGENKAETLANIQSGKYELTDLN